MNKSIEDYKAKLEEVSEHPPPLFKYIQTICKENTTCLTEQDGDYWLDICSRMFYTYARENDPDD